MRLTTFSEFSLRVLIFVAAHPQRRATIAQIARAYGISENHLVKVVHFLGKAGFLANERGRHGGIRLAHAAQDINVGAVVRTTEGEPVPAACFDAHAVPCSIARPCRLREVLREAVDAFYAILDRYSLQDLVDNASELRPILMTCREATPNRAAQRVVR